MAYDPSHEEALQNISRLHNRDFGHIYTIADDPQGLPLEFECKLKHTPMGKILGPINAANKGAQDCMALLRCLDTELSTYLDEQTAPNKYILTSAGLDSVAISQNTPTPQPTAEFRLRNMQLRVRFPIFVSGRGTETSPIVPPNQYDANMKDHLSSMQSGEHRIELETAIHDPSTCLQSLKGIAKGAFPTPFKHLKDNDLRVTCFNMTARTSFFLVIQIPKTEHYALIHGSYDSSRALPNQPVAFADLTSRNEMELEVKALMGNHPSLSDPIRQAELINQLFDTIYATAKHHNFSQSTHSKLEEAEAAVAKFIRERTEYPTAKKQDPILKQFLSQRFNSANNTQPAHGLGEYAFALMQDIRISQIFDPLLGRNAYDTPIVRRATGLPNSDELLPKRLLVPETLRLIAV